MPAKKLVVIVFGFVRENSQGCTYNIPTEITQMIVLFYYFACDVYAAGFNKRQEWGLHLTKVKVDYNHNYHIGNSCIYTHLKRLSELLQHPNDLYQAECAIFVKHDNEIYGAGDIEKYIGMKHLTNKDIDTVAEFTKLSFPKSMDNDYIEIMSSGHDPKCSIFISKKNQFFGVGINTYSQLGVAGAFSQISQLEGLSSIFQHEQVVKIQCSEAFTIFLTKSGQLFGCGRNINYMCGIQSDSPIMKKPTHISVNVKNVEFLDIFVGREHTLCLSDKYRLYGFGSNGYGQLAMDRDSIKCCVIVPCLYFERHGIRIVELSVGGWHNFIVDDMHKCYSWGFNEDGQTGHFNEQPSQLEEFMDIKIENVYCGLWHMMILTKSNELYGLGYNANGEVSVSSPHHSFKHREPYHLTREEIGIDNECKIEGVITGYQSTLILVAKQ